MASKPHPRLEAGPAPKKSASPRAGARMRSCDAMLHWNTGSDVRDILRCRRPGEGRDPDPPWIPAFAGMTTEEGVPHNNPANSPVGTLE